MSLPPSPNPLYTILKINILQTIWKLKKWPKRIAVDWECEINTYVSQVHRSYGLFVLVYLRLTVSAEKFIISKSFCEFRNGLKMQALCIFKISRSLTRSIYKGVGLLAYRLPNFDFLFIFFCVFFYWVLPIFFFCFLGLFVFLFLSHVFSEK